jgi:TusE/DsrC/DsvC family sulfur relay protein
MLVIEKEGLKITVDDDGFLVRLEDWTEQVARVLAAKEGIAELTEDKLDILKFMREYYQKHHFFPIVRYVCKNLSTRSKPGRSPACRTPARK